MQPGCPCAHTLRAARSRRYGRGEVGMSEVVALEEQRFTRGFGEGVGETVTEVQTGPVATATAVRTVGVPGECGVIRGDVDDLDPGSRQKPIQPCGSHRVAASVDDDA